MDSHLGFIAVMTIAIAAPLLLYLSKLASVTPEANQNETLDLRQQILIIDRKDLTTGQPLRNRNEARTAPNQRLKATFGIDNIFTSEDLDWGGKFRKLTIITLKRALKMDTASQDRNPDWTPLVRVVITAVDQQLQAEDDSINLAKLVQSVTLKVSLSYLFGVPEQILSSNSDEIMSIATRINELWMQSKGRDGHERHLPTWYEEHAIIQNLLTVIPDHDPRDPRNNPMNLILPAYETMWRAVFRGLLEVRFRGRGCNQHDHARHKQLLITYLQDPNNANSWRCDSGAHNHTVSTIDVVKEILRLYPPTRRIYRKYPDHEDFISADLEKMQRNRHLAGNDPETFRPARWLEIRQRFLQHAGTETRGRLKDFEEELGFMPFARVCPAGNRTTHAFGWKMIALLIGALIEGLDRLDGEWVLQAGEKRDELPVCGVALGSAREDYLSLAYEKAS